MDKKFCIFDMDGTITDSMGCWRNLGREFLAAKGVTEGVDEVMKKIKPLTLAESAVLFVETFDLPVSPREALVEMAEMMRRHYIEDIPLRPGIEIYLEKLIDCGRVRAGIATATDRELATMCLSRLGVMKYFDFIVSCEDVGKNKNSPDVYFEACRAFGVPDLDIRDVAVYEDAYFAGRTAKNEGFYTVAVFEEGRENNWEKFTAIADEAATYWEAAARELER